MLILKILIGVIIILISLFAMFCKIGQLFAVLGAIIMAIILGATEEWLPTIWHCDTDIIMLILLGLFAGSLIVGQLVSSMLGNIMGGIGGIACGVLTLGVLDVEVVNAIMGVAIVPLLGVGVFVIAAVLFLVWLFRLL